MRHHKRNKAARGQPLDPSLLFRQLVDSVKDYAIFTTDLTGKITTWNSGAERLTGFSAKEVVGKNADLIFIPEDRRVNEPQKELDRAKNEGSSPNERWHLKKGGARFWGSGMVNPLFDERGRQIGFVKIMRDVTERKRMRDELARKSDELEQFCHVVAHDLQSPINKIYSFAELLKKHAKDCLDPVSLGFLDRILQSGTRMTRLIGDLLKFAKTTDPQGHFEPVDLNDILTGVLSDLEVVIAKKQAKIKLEKLPIIRAHPPQMHQLFLNLISNSLKFSRPNVKPLIKVSAKKRKDYWELSVSDNGIGFDPRDTKQLFRPFARLHSYHQFEGSGIGLARCKKIVDFHAGTISAQGYPNKGAIFTLTLPSSLNKDDQAVPPKIR